MGKLLQFSDSVTKRKVSSAVELSEEGVALLRQCNALSDSISSLEKALVSLQISTDPLVSNNERLKLRCKKSEIATQIQCARRLLGELTLDFKTKLLSS